MNKRHVIQLVSLLFINFYVYSQKLQLGKVTLDELNEKSHPTDTSAVAAILFKSGTSSFYLSQEGKWSIETKVNYKIKIYKKEGLEYGNHAVSYYVGGNQSEIVNFSNCITYNEVNGAIEKTKLKSEGEFKEEINSDWKQKKISLPSVKVGSIIEFSYKLVSPYITTFNDWKFQTDIPTNHVEYATYIPSYFTYNSIITGYEDIKYKSEDIYNSEYGEKKHIYYGDNIPAIKDEKYVNNIDNYTSILKFELASINYPNQPTENVALNWEGVTKTIYDSENFGMELAKKGYFEEDLQLLLKNAPTKDEKINAILNFVKSKIKWNDKFGVYCKDGVKKAYKDSKGDVAEINLILTAMLREAGLEANPILVSTRANGISNFPSRTSYNYVICGLETENEVILLDATDENALPNILPIRALNWIGRIIRKDKTSATVELNPKKISSDAVIILATINSDGKIEGKIKELYTNYNAFLFRDKYANLAEDVYLETLEKKLDNVEITEYESSGKKELKESVIEKYSFKHSNSTETIGDKLYFSPLLFFATTENPFKQDLRKYPVDFIFPNQDKYIVNITIPDGYIVESLPKSVSIQMTDNRILFKYQIANTNNKIQFTLSLDTNQSMFYAEDYEELKAIYSEIIKKENEKIVLKKV